MAFQFFATVSFGTTKGGLSTVGYALYNADGSLNTARTTAGIAERGTNTGIYGATITLPSSFTGEIRWDTGDGSPYYASQTVNPAGGTQLAVNQWGQLSVHTG